MTHEERNTTGILNSTAELRLLIVENPELPLLVFAGEEANSGDYSFMSCSNIHACLGEYLDCQQTIDDCRCYTDRSDFEEDLAEVIIDECDSLSDEEWYARVQKELAEYEPYWRPCIILYVDN